MKSIKSCVLISNFSFSPQNHQTPPPSLSDQGHECRWSNYQNSDLIQEKVILRIQRFLILFVTISNVLCIRIFNSVWIKLKIYYFPKDIWSFTSFIRTLFLYSLENMYFKTIVGKNIIFDYIILRRSFLRNKGKFNWNFSKVCIIKPRD